MIRTAVTLALTLFAACAAAAQAVTGRVTAAPSGAPVEGAVVQLVDETGQTAGGALTAADGSYRLRPARPGSYRLRVERIGFATRTSEPVEIGEGAAVVQSFSVSEEAVPLAGITATGQPRGCVVRDGSAAVARVWDEARKALNAVRITQSDQLVLFDIESFHREIDPRTNQLRHEERRAAFGRTENPFRSIPAEDLRRWGFVRAFPDSTVYYGPDADLLLSDAFLDDHCFRIHDSQEDPSLVGLEFRPVPGRDLADIEGVLWLDRNSSELRSVEYQYVGTAGNTPVGPADGEIEFDRMDNGAWIVRRWVIRMPELELQRNRWDDDRGGVRSASRTTVAGIVEEGGEVVAVREPGPAASNGSFAVLGVVIDSLSGEPLEGATVYLSGTGHEARTDAEGRFAISGVAGNEYIISFTHPRLESLGVSPLPQRVEVGRGEEHRVELAVPSETALLARYCPGAEAGTGMIAGYVRRRGDGEPIAGARVWAEWIADSSLRTESLSRRVGGAGVEVRSGGARFDVRVREVEVATDYRGLYRVCGAALSGEAQLRANAEGAGSGRAVTVRLAPLVAQDLTVEG